MITVFGSINVDLVTRVARSPAPGETVHGSDYALIPGGKGANQALAARRAGARVRLIGAIGDDFLARVALTELEAAGVELAEVARMPGPTGVAIITVDAKGENTIVVAPGANAHVSAAALRPDRFAAGDTLLLQMEVPFAESLAAARMARAAGARVILSVAPYAPLSLADTAAFDMLIVNEHEAADLARHHGIAPGVAEATVAALALKLGRTVIATLGPEGAVAAGPEATVRVPALPVTVVDTTGAGDTFCGVLAAWLDEGASLRTAMARAAVAGSLAVTRAGAQPSFPTRAEIQNAAEGRRLPV
ncbi:ribokinase [soil metagenome]